MRVEDEIAISGALGIGMLCALYWLLMNNLGGQ